MSDRAAKLDSTGQPFRIRERGGKSSRRKKELQNKVVRGEHVPQEPWTEEKRQAKSTLVGGGFEGCSAGSTSEGPVCTSEVVVLTPRRPEGSNPPSLDAAEVTGQQLEPLPSAASSGVSSEGSGLALEFGSGFGSSSGSREKRKLAPAEPALPSSAKSRSKALAVETSYRVIFDYHGVLDDHEDNFTQTSKKFIRELLNTSVFVEVLILSYIGVHGPHSQTRRENLQRQAFEFQRSLGRAGSRFGVAIVPSKRQKALVCRDTLPVLFCDDQKPLVESCRPHCKLAEQIGPQNSLEQAVAKAEALRIPPSVTPRAWKELIQAPIV